MFSVYCYEDDVGFQNGVLVVRHVHHMREKVGGTFGFPASDHHVIAAPYKPDGQGFGKVSAPQDAYRGFFLFDAICAIG